VRACGSILTRLAKSTGIPIVIVGQITKGGGIAGPKILEHTVDCVLYVEGGEFNVYRVLRGIKNRFGSTNEIGVFEMKADGMIEVKDPSKAFLESGGGVSGSAIGVITQGSRVVFVEIQALVSEKGGEAGPIRRVANGIKKPRLDMLCAVLSRRGGVFIGDRDVFVNVVGGFTVDDPVIDLAVCAAIKSSLTDTILNRESVYVGEVGLTGEVRGALGLEAIVKESARLGYKSVFMSGKSRVDERGVAIKRLKNIKEL